MLRRLTVWIASLTLGLLMMALVLASAAHAQGTVGGKDAALTGDWTGVIVSPNSGRLRTLLHVTASGVTLDVPDQGAFGVPVTRLTQTGGTVSFEISRLQATWRGTLAGGVLTGTFVQGVEVPLTFTRYATNRPQTPKPPLPYRVEEVAFESAPGIKLAGSLTLPAGKGPFPAAVMITGSGQQDRDETIFGHKPFAVIADSLTRRGVAVLRLDDRGAGGSTGDFTKATMDDFAADTRAAVAFLRGRRDIAPARVGLIGHSEGGMIGPMVAANDPKIAFVVLLAGPGAPFRELMPAQRAAMGKAAGFSPQVLAANEALVAQAEAATEGAKDSAEAQARVQAALANRHLPPALEAQMVRSITSPGYLSMLAYDARPNLTKLRMPVLALVGSKDLQVPAAQNIPALQAALQGNPQATVTELPGLNHLLQDADTGLVSEYVISEQTISPKALDLLGDWISSHDGKAGRS